MIAAVLLGLAEIELEYRRERQPAGISVAKKRGVYKGRKKGKPERARELKDKGLSPGEIATALGVSERTIWRYLTPSTGPGPTCTARPASHLTPNTPSTGRPA
jgi:DNA invertase Pin-like site-specific DNA recombinase